MIVPIKYFVLDRDTIAAFFLLSFFFFKLCKTHSLFHLDLAHLGSQFFSKKESPSKMLDPVPKKKEIKRFSSIKF